MTRHVCFVTGELHPFTGGGIGRLLHNLVRSGLELSPEATFHLLLPDTAGIDPRRVSELFGERVRAHVAVMREGWEPSLEFETVYPPAAAFTDSAWHAESLDFMRALKRLAAAGQSFDVIEFPDYHGWAYCTLQEKHLGLAFRETLIAVRLHSTDGILQRFEPREPTVEQAARCELERKALHDADLVVAHLPAIAGFNREHYRFEEAWAERVVVQFPPVVWGAPEEQAVPERRGPGDERDLLFATKIQTIKRPDVFIRGAALFMRDTPEYKGSAVLACHAADPSYADRMRRLVPPSLGDRFRFLPPGPDRDQLLGRSIVVIPSAYESCNLVAYEAAARGGTLVLNGKCLAFGDGAPFRDGVNCHKFDGTVEGLARALREAWLNPSLAPVAWRAGRPYWLDVPGQRPARRWPERLEARVSVVVTNYNLAGHLPRALSSVAASTHRDLELVVVDDASTEALDAAFLDRLEKDAAVQHVPVRVIRNAVNRGLPGARNVGIRNATGRYILPLDADDAISPAFIELAVRALEACPEYDVVVPSAGYFRGDDALAHRRFTEYALFIGDAPSLGLVANRLSCATSLLRRSLFERFQYDEGLDSYEDWDLYLRLAHAGCRFLVTNGVHFYYRSRPGSMTSGMSCERHFRLLERMTEKLPTGESGMRLFPLLAHAASRAQVVEAFGCDPLGPFPLRYKIADAVNLTLKRAVPNMHPAFKRTVAAVKRLAGSRQRRTGR